MSGNSSWRARVQRPQRRGATNGVRGHVVITGGAGFIGANLADRLLEEGEQVLILDDLSRAGVDRNADWLQSRHPGRFRLLVGDVRDRALVEHAVEGSSFIFHLAAQVAVTTSLQAPRDDHETNVVGTLNVLEAVRGSKCPPGLMFASTNKVYGALPDIDLTREGLRYVPRLEHVRRHGIGEDQPLAFVSPYGCSKGAADQYVLDYCRSYGLDAVVFRMSCIYGPHQQANGDQGWVTHFLRSALLGSPLTIYGDGCQVRDVLYIQDFVAALLAARRQLVRLSGNAFNMGGGPANSLSLLELLQAAERLAGRSIVPRFAPPRRGDQPYFAADLRRFASVTGWRPRVVPEAGIARVWDWLLEETTQAEPPAAGGQGRSREVTYG